MAGMFFFLANILFSQTFDGQKKDAPMSSLSYVNWVDRNFDSKITLDIQKAQIKMPSGKNAALLRINNRLPNLIKDPLLTLYVNSENQLGDMILENDIVLKDIVEVIDNSQKTLGYFKDDTTLFNTNSSVKLDDLSSLLIRHNQGYMPRLPIETISSRKYSGIIIDARGTLPVHGEYVDSVVSPCFFPRVWDDQMSIVYEYNMMDGEDVKVNGTCTYDYTSDDEKRYKNKIGSDPLHITAKKTFGRNRTDIIISKKDALKISSIPENRELLRQGKVVILLNKEELIHEVKAPLKDDLYYMALKDINIYPARKILDISNIQDGPEGIRFIYDVKFVADSAELLESEGPRLKELAQMLKQITIDNSFTILVEGHTADIGQAENQMQLSIDRTQTIIRSLVQEGMDNKIFSYKGYGATKPDGDNKTTPEGMARNRRVVITLRPKATYIQRDW